MYNELDFFDNSFDQFEHDGSVMFHVEQFDDEFNCEIEDEEIPF